MKIALVSAYDYPYPGGVTEHVSALADHLAVRGHEVVIIAPSDAPPATLAPNVRPVHGVREIRGNGASSRLGLAPSTGRQVRAILQAEQPDIVHIHEPMQPLVPLLALRHSQAVNIGTFHAYGPPRPILWLLARALGGPLGRLHGRIAVSPLAAEYANGYLPGDYTVIPNGVDVERFAAPGLPPPALAHEQPTILFVGRYNEPRKGLGVLLRALPQVQAAVPGVRLVVVGGGDPAPFAALLPPDPTTVTFVGRIAAADLPSYYQHTTVYCAPSTGQESFGIVLLEAMAAGTAVVASRNPGYAGVLTDGVDGLLAPPHDAPALAAALVRVLTQPDLRARLAAGGRATAARYAWPLVAARIETLYQTTTAGRGA